MPKTIAERYNSIRKDLTDRKCTGDLGNLSVFDLKVIHSLVMELISTHSVKAMIKTVADYFKSFGFKVVMDFDGINYVIVEA